MDPSIGKVSETDAQFCGAVEMPALHPSEYGAISNEEIKGDKWAT
jgi:hypothetical protein